MSTEKKALNEIERFFEDSKVVDYMDEDGETGGLVPVSDKMEYVISS